MDLGIIEPVHIHSYKDTWPSHPSVTLVTFKESVIELLEMPSSVDKLVWNIIKPDSKELELILSNIPSTKSFVENLVNKNKDLFDQFMKDRWYEWLPPQKMIYFLSMWWWRSIRPLFYSENYKWYIKNNYSHLYEDEENIWITKGLNHKLEIVDYNILLVKGLTLQDAKFLWYWIHFKDKYISPY